MKRGAALFLLLLSGAARAQQARTDVPVSSVVLFSSGVGYFEHSGTMHGGGATELRFRTNQLNDVIKSLVLQDLDGGKVTSITYPSQDPLAKTLKSFQVDITANPSLAQLLNQLRGSRVILQSQAERITGTILGVETRPKLQPTPDAVVEVPVLNLVSGGTIRSIELQSITSLTLDDPQLQDELTKALTSLTQARDQDKKPVIINFAGTGDRRVKVAYVVEAPVWKTSYRLLLDEKTAKIQGWGIVENQTESDWNNVDLSLVSGRPVSFIMDLYSPVYLQRPTVTPEQYAQLRPQIYAGGTMAAADPVSRIQLRSATGTAGGEGVERARVPYAVQRLGDADIPNRLSEVVVTGLNASASVESRAEGQQLGELFQFTVRNVTLPRQKSAMIPIVTDDIEVERVSIYNASVMATNPLNGVRLRNTTGKSLLQGPVTVLDHESYAGDARIGDLPMGQERLLSYGIDLETLVNSTHTTSADAIVTSKIIKGMLTIDRRVQTSRDYVIDNKSDKARTVIIEHPATPDRKLVDSPVPYETTNRVHRFRVVVPAGKVVTTTIREQMIYTQTVQMLNNDVTMLLNYSRTAEIPKAVREAIAKAASLRQTALDLDAQVGARVRRATEINAEQGRIRENMKTVGQTSQYYSRLLEKLNEQESELETLQRERDDLAAKRDAVQRELAEYLTGLTIE